MPSETVIILDPSECNILTKRSAFDCNSVTKKHIKELIRLVEEKVLVLKGEMSQEHLTKLLVAAKKSPLVENRVKKMV